MTKIHSRPEGRSMPHPVEAKNPDGSFDKLKAAVGAMDAARLFLTDEYVLVDMDEGVVDSESEVNALNSLGSNGQIGDEYMIVRRRKAA